MFKTKTILKDLETHSNRDVKKFTHELENQKEVLLSNHKIDIGEMEKAYFLSKNGDIIKSLLLTIILINIRSF